MQSKRWIAMVLVALAALWGVHEVRERRQEAQAKEQPGSTTEQARPTGAARQRQPVAGPEVVKGPSAPQTQAPAEVPLKRPAVATEAPGVAAPGRDLFAQAVRLEAEGDRSGAAVLLRRALEQAGGKGARARVALRLAGVVEDPLEQRRLWSLALKGGAARGAAYDRVGRGLAALNRSPAASLVPLVRTERYEVAAGDSLWRLCHEIAPQRYAVRPEVGLLQLVNGLTDSVLQVGQVLAVPVEPVRLQVDVAGHGLSAWIGDHLLAAWQVGLGKENRTPRGSFTVKVKQEDPAWFQQGRMIPNGDPENVLGTRWLGFEEQAGARGYGIHGTSDPESVGQDVSMGCVRMRNEDVERLFELVPRGTSVEIR